jgi:hypothetical protein
VTFVCLCIGFAADAAFIVRCACTISCIALCAHAPQRAADLPKARNLKGPAFIRILARPVDVKTHIGSPVNASSISWPLALKGLVRTR